MMVVLVVVMFAAAALVAREIFVAWSARQLLETVEAAERELGIPCGLCGYDRWVFRNGGPPPSGVCPRCGKDHDAA